MNRGEGLKYAAQAKSTTINLFGEKEKKKPKKFGYKRKGQQFTVRKGQNVEDKPPANKPPTTKPQTTKGKPNTKDFVKKNAHAASAGKVKEKKKVTAPSAGGGSTVTLTQDQLNAILATIGTAAGSGAAIPNISLANGTIKVDNQHEEPNQRSSIEKSHNAPISETEQNRSDGENIVAFNETTESQDKHNGNSYSQSINTATIYDIPEKSHELQSGNPHRHDANNDERTHSKSGVASRTSHPDRKPPQAHGIGYGDVSSIIGDNQRLTLAEKKKQQWKKELDEQIAIKRQQQNTSDGGNRGGVRGSRGQGPDDHLGWSPGRGGPRADDHLGRSPGAPNTNLNLDLSAVTVAEKSDGPPSFSKSREPTSSRITPRDVSSSLGKLATEKYAPAAMRSSFIIGGDAVDSHNTMLKKKEKRQWLEDLEHQRQQEKERKERDKQKLQEMDDRMTSHWADTVISPRPKPAAPPTHSQVKPRSTVDDFEVKKETSAHAVSPPRHHSADALPSARQDDTDTGMHTRPSGLLVDPLEAERREQKRNKHLEHMLAVKEQVEERQRIKREAIDAKKREEAEEEKKLADERDRLQRQYDMDAEKQRKKEEEAAAKQKAMMESVQAAYESSQREKHQKRMNRLQSQGHDVNNLRHSWDAMHISPENSPRHQPIPVETSPRLQSMNQHHQVRHSPHLDPITTTHSPRRSIGLDPSSVGEQKSVKTHDMATSPVFDQAVQTDFQFPPSDVIKERTFDIEREGSAGVEYKPDRQPKRKKDGQKKVKGQDNVDKGKDRTVKIQDKNKRLTKTKSEEILEDEVTSKRTNKDKPRPIWGQGKQNKKKLGNTQKDLTGNQKKREERRRQRMEDMLALQEKSAPKRLTEKKKPASVPHSRTTSRANSTVDVVKAKKTSARAATEIDLRQERKTSKAWTDDSKETASLPSSPPLRSGDFVPFLRHDEELDERSIPGSPPPVSRHSHHNYGDNNHGNKMRDVESKTVTPKPERTRLSSIDKKDPLLNPDRLKDSNLRQEKILEQLSNLRQGLMMKQRELEMGLSTSTPLIM